MTPIALARNLAADTDPKSHALAVAIIARGLSDDDGTRQGWPLDSSIVAAVRYLGLTRTDSLIADATVLAPTLSDAILNKGAAR